MELQDQVLTGLAIYPYSTDEKDHTIVIFLQLLVPHYHTYLIPGEAVPEVEIKNSNNLLKPTLLTECGLKAQASVQLEACGFFYLFL